MNELLKILKEQPKEMLLYIIYDLMKEDKFSFSELAELHVKHLEALKKGETKKLVELRTRVLKLWCGTKKDIGKGLTALIQKGKDEGYYNFREGEIENSKWNR